MCGSITNDQVKCAAHGTIAEWLMVTFWARQWLPSDFIFGFRPVNRP
jgi:hypothetical protein